MLHPTTDRLAPDRRTYHLGVVDLRPLVASEAEDDGGKLLLLWVAGGPAQMFIELSRLGPDALRDPATRKTIASRFDSIPV